MVNEISETKIDKLTGRELDETIHEVISGHKTNSMSEIPHYSSLIEDTISVLEWLMEQGDVFIEWWQDGEWFICNQDLSTRRTFPKLGWQATSDKVSEDMKPSLSLAICRAALKEHIRREEIQMMQEGENMKDNEEEEDNDGSDMRGWRRMR